MEDPLRGGRDRGGNLILPDFRMSFHQVDIWQFILFFSGRYSSCILELSLVNGNG